MAVLPRGVKPAVEGATVLDIAMENIEPNLEIASAYKQEELIIAPDYINKEVDEISIDLQIDKKEINMSQKEKVEEKSPEVVDEVKEEVKDESIAQEETTEEAEVQEVVKEEPKVEESEESLTEEVKEDATEEIEKKVEEEASVEEKTEEPQVDEKEEVTEEEMDSFYYNPDDEKYLATIKELDKAKGDNEKRIAELEAELAKANKQIEFIKENAKTILDRREELGEYAQDLTDEQVMDKAYYELTKLKKEKILIF